MAQWVLGTDGVPQWQNCPPSTVTWSNADTVLHDPLCHTTLGPLRLVAVAPGTPYSWPVGLSPRWPIELLCSAVQKAIRRCRVAAAADLYRQVARQGRDDFLVLLRRLPVFCVEDAVPHDDLPLAVWMLAAMSKGWHPGVEHLERLGRLVQDLAGCPWRFPRHKATLEEMRSQAFPRHPLAVACRIRTCYGGAKKQMRVLRGVPWSLLIQTCPRQPRYHAVLGDRGPLAPAHRLVEAVDYHTYPNLIRDLRRDLPHIAQDKKQLRLAIQNARVARTDKRIYLTNQPVPRDTSYDALFADIAGYLDRCAQLHWERHTGAAPQATLRQSAIVDYFEMFRSNQ